MSTLPLPPFTLLPANDPQTSADEQVAAAVAGALALPASLVPVADPPVAPFGRTWQFDYELGRFIYAGSSPADTNGFGAVAQWCLMAIYSARYGHAVFSDDFGMEEPHSLIGEFAVGETLADWRRHLIEALLVHDRITSIENLLLDWDPSTGVLTIRRLDVVTDASSVVTISDVSLRTGVGA